MTFKLFGTIEWNFQFNGVSKSGNDKIKQKIDGWKQWCIFWGRKIHFD